MTNEAHAIIRTDTRFFRLARRRLSR